MTAVVGVLNMSAVAIAADSAVTVTNRSNQKIFNNANKIFQLSKRHPVGLAIYGSGSLMYTPWEVIIKMYRNQAPPLGFGTISEYREDFLEYLRRNNYFSTTTGFEGKTAGTVKSILDSFALLIQSLIINPDPQAFFALTPQEQRNILQSEFKRQLRETANNLSSLPAHNGQYEQFSRHDLLSAITESNAYKSILSSHNITAMGWMDQEAIGLFEDYLHKYLLTSDFSHSTPTGLVFVGYGNTQMYPQCHSVEIAEVIKDTLRWRLYTDTSINESTQSAVVPFAQADVINTILYGLSPEVDSTLR